MKCAKRFGMAIFVIATALSSAVVMTTQVGANSTKVKVDKTKVDKKTVSVPEPATIVLLGAAAGVAGIRKAWQVRHRSRRVGLCRAAAPNRPITS